MRVGFEIVVVGSLNYDVSVRTERLPRPGETVLGKGHYFGHGGKGANQAFAAARLGASVSMIGRVGSDANGAELRSSLADVGVDVSGVSVDDSVPTGLAAIVIDDAAENTIVVSPGANSALSPDVVESHAEILASADLVLAQLEVPVESVLRAAQLATGRILLNPAPARPIPNALVETVDVLIPNRSELAAIADAEEPESVEAVRSLAMSFDRGGSMVVTLGGDGALVVSDEEPVHIPPYAVEPVDPTGAGDAFCAALAVALARGESLVDASTWAAAAGALATTASGAQSAMPSRDAVDALASR